MDEAIKKLEFSILVMLRSTEYWKYIENIRRFVMFYVNDNIKKRYIRSKRILVDEMIDKEVSFIAKIIRIHHTLKSNEQIIRITKIGDNHNGREAVSIIETNRDKYVLKPRSDKVIFLFRDILRWMNSHNAGHTIFESVDILCREENYYCESFLKEKKPEKRSEVIYDLGMLFSIFVLLETADMHAENYLLTDKGIYFCDIESLIGWNDKGVKKYIQESIFLRALLLVTSDRKDNVSREECINLKSNFQFNLFNKGIIYGFECVFKEKEKFLSIFEKHQKCELRMLFRDTKEYEYYLIDCSNLKETELICTNVVNEDIVKTEKASLKMGDIPYFYFKLGNVEIISGSRNVGKFRRGTVFDQISERVRELRRDDVTIVLEQVKLLRNDLKSI